MEIHSNFRLCVRSEKGGRNYMEDEYAVHFEEKDAKDGSVDMEFGFFGVFDGHGGPEASKFTRDNLLKEIKSREGFWSENDDDILEAIREGFLATHHAMWNERPKWPKRSNIHPSTAGTTASIAILKNNKLYVGHVGDSGIVLGEDVGDKFSPVDLKATPLTKDHKPEDPEEVKRIENMGGKVASKSGVKRVVWNRPKKPHSGPIRRSTQMDEIPFLAVARSLGDLWSHNPFTNQYAVSPEPDLSVIKLDFTRHRFLIFGSDGLWNMMSPAEAVRKVGKTDRIAAEAAFHMWYDEVCWENPSKKLVDSALTRWQNRGLRADNITCLTVMLDPPGQGFDDVIKRRRKINFTRPEYLYEEVPEHQQDETWELVARYAGFHDVVQKKYDRLGTSMPSTSMPTPPPEKEAKVPPAVTEVEIKTTDSTPGSKRSTKRFAAKKIKRLDLVQRRVSLDLGAERHRDWAPHRVNRPRSLPHTNSRGGIRHKDRLRGVHKNRTQSLPIPCWQRDYTGPGKVMIARARDINATPPPMKYILEKERLLKEEEMKNKLAADRMLAESNAEESSPPPGVCTPPKTPDVIAAGGNKNINDNNSNKQNTPPSKKNVPKHSCPKNRQCLVCPVVGMRPTLDLPYYGVDVAKEGERVLEEMRNFRQQIIEKRQKQVENCKTLSLKKQVNGVDNMHYTRLKRKRSCCESPVKAKSRRLDTKSAKEKFNKSVTNSQRQQVSRACKVRT